jgi:N12 class adenine-specific DNA methylase
MDAETWLGLFEQMCLLTDPNEAQMTPQQKLRALLKNLNGPALAMAIAEGQTATYSQVVSVLRKMYQRHNLAGTNLDHFNRLKQLSHQKVEDFHVQFSLAYAKVRRTSKDGFVMAPQLLAQRFRDALLPDIANSLSVFSEIDSYETMVSKAISIERAQERHRPSRSSARVTFVSPRQDARPNRGGWRTGCRVFPRRGRC